MRHGRTAASLIGRGRRPSRHAGAVRDRRDGTGPPLIVEAAGPTRSFGRGAAAVQALRGASLTLRRGQLVALCGRSGSGKTTLLNIIGGLDTPDSGTVLVNGRDVAAMGERERSVLRRSAVAFIFQSFGLIPSCPRLRTSACRCASRARVSGSVRSGSRLMLDIVGLAGHAAHSARPNCPAASSSEWPSPGRWPEVRSC